MFAIIDESGRQMRVQSGDVIQVDYRAGVEPGQDIVFDRVLLANAGAASIVGRPVIESATVTATVVSPVEKGEKLYIQKFRRRKTYRKRTGHRQKYTSVRIGDINVPGIEQKSQDEQAASAE